MKTHFLRFICLACVLVWAMPVFAAETSTTKKGKKSPDTEGRGLVAVEKNRDGRKRVALVIGNSNYLSSPLKNPVNDAHAMAVSLRKLGFEVDEKTNLGYIAMNKSFESFRKKLSTGGVGLFYYAGHGMQVNGSNYLIPVDSQIEDENEIIFKAVDAGLVLAKMEQSKTDVNLVILDACRDNPFARSFRSASRGLAQINAPTGTLISYATAPGKTASDGKGKNGVYTEALIQAMESPGLKVEEVFKMVRRLVLEKTANAQVPWESSSLVGDFHFIQASSMTDIQPSPVQPQPLPKSTQDIEAKAPRQVESGLIYTDPNTGLMWPRNGNIAGKNMNWDNAMKWVKSLDIGGYRDWRLPSKEELENFAKQGGGQPLEWYNSNGFYYVMSGSYWSSSKFEVFDTVWGINMPNGKMYNGYKSNYSYVWPVRDGKLSVISQPDLSSNPKHPSAVISRGFTDSATGIEFVNVPGGCFQMGDTFGDGFDNEKPGHEACVSDFAIGKYEVTQGQWRQIMGSNLSHFSSCGDNCPVENISWNDSQEFIRKLSSQSGRNYRLPTESEWEYAARSGGSDEKYSGGNNVETVAWYSGISGSKTHAVGRMQPNGLGIFDMSGNAWEWVNDWYGNYTSDRQQDPQGPSTGTSRVLRGGSWSSGAGGVRAAIRYFLSPGFRDFNLGFRLASPIQ